MPSWTRNDLSCLNCPRCQPFRGSSLEMHTTASFPETPVRYRRGCSHTNRRIARPIFVPQLIRKPTSLTANIAKNHAGLQHSQETTPCLAQALSRRNVNVHFRTPLSRASYAPALQRVVAIYRDRAPYASPGLEVFGKNYVSVASWAALRMDSAFSALFASPKKR